MEFRQLSTFRTVATLGSFSLAADRLGYAQSTVSGQIKALEDDLCVRLFTRIGKQVTLTAAGENLLQYAQKMVNLEEEIRSEIGESEEVLGSLTIRIPETVSTFYLPPVLKEFNRRFPKVDFHLTNCTYFSLQEELRSGIVNLAFLITDRFQSADLETESLTEIPLIMVASPKNALSQRPAIHLSDLGNHPLLEPTNDCSYVLIVDRLLTEQKIERSVLMRMNCIQAIKQTLISGIGVSILPQISVQNELDSGSLLKLPWVEGPIEARLYMIWLRNKWQSPLVKSFIHTIHEQQKLAP